MSSMIEIVNLSKEYQRGRRAVDHLNLNIQAGEIFGFVGPNGAGKTSTIRMMCTLLRPSAGDIHIAGFSVRRSPQAVRQAIGYMPDFFGVYNDLLVWEYLDFFAACYQIPVSQRKKLIADLLDLVELGQRQNDSVENLSRGMKQRLSLARTLLHDPQVLILDEPASGLDPRARVEIRQLLVELAQLGKTIFFSTHILSDVTEICTHVGILEGGKLVASGSMEELKRLILPYRKLNIRVLAQPSPLPVREEAKASTWLEEALRIVRESELELDPSAEAQESSLTPESGLLSIAFRGEDQALSHLLASLVQQGIPVVQFEVESGNMEAVFMAATKGLVT